jgi:hypothetical protein
MHDHTTMLPVISVDEPESGEPRSADLPLGRVLLALAVAPLLGATLMTLGISIASPYHDGTRWPELALSMLAPVAWSLICGLAYLRTIARMRDQIARAECLLLGCGSGLLLPFVIDVTGTLFLLERLPTVDWTHIKVYLLAGLFTLPFGLFGGWVFWRIGVRPAMPRTRDLSGVFD